MIKHFSDITIKIYIYLSCFVLGLTRSASSPAGRDRTGSIMSTSSSVSSYDDYDTLSPLTANDVINFTTLTRRHSRQQW